ncbi:hypothetical protein DES53_11515 [Roseimicrobium gellanilyticum]|uniref:Uncharacterized protein n=1 Tax=Roseimicrobium gellanilyticum TaxID=748857 RepID=A0A366H4D0_9BACT|nr:hypothetical protein [Roseimicrobium gellanilyticum]RBP36874.1 hypothetical protein DES53_11515 [Roseimicrobium gellanilyticum]
MIWTMKVYRVLLCSMGATHVEATRFERDTIVRFFRGDVVIAEYPASLVKEVAETDLPPSGGWLVASASSDD